MRLTTAILRSALRPQLEFQDRLDLDWSASLLDRLQGRALNEQFEYQGSNIPLGRLLDFAAHRRCTTREVRR